MRRTPAADGLLAGDFEDADFAGADDVRAAAEFLAVEAARRRGVGNRHDADIRLRVLVAEEGEGAGGERVVDVHDVGREREIAEDLFVHLLLDFGEFACVHGCEVRKIEAQMIGRDERAGLLHVRAENIAQRGVHQVRRGVVAHVARAADGIGDGGDAVADVEIFLRDDSVRDESAHRIVGALHFGELRATCRCRRTRRYRPPGRRIRSRWRCGRERFRLRRPP